MQPDSRIRPNLFLVGAPKCGTTSLYESLRQHPQIFFPPVIGEGYWLAKEPQFFCPEIGLPPELSIKDERDYLALYAGGENHPFRGDASTWYLYPESAASRIKAFSPDARILIILKPPLAQMRSLHNDLLRTDFEVIADFHEAVSLSGLPRDNSNTPPRFVPAWLDYMGASRFAVQVERYQRTFGRGAVHVVLLEDFSAHPEETYRGILEFLGVDPDFIPDFRVYNEAPASSRVERLLHGLHALPGVKHLSNAVFPYRVRRRVISAIRNRHARAAADPRDAALRERCRPEIERLARLLGRDLSHWM